MNEKAYSCDGDFRPHPPTPFPLFAQWNVLAETPYKEGRILLQFGAKSNRGGYGVLPKPDMVYFSNLRRIGAQERALMIKALQALR
jgi:hypothetical protein